MTDKVTMFATASENSTHWTVEQMLRDALREVESGKRVATKAVVLFLDDSGGTYKVGYHNAGLSASQIISLFEVGKVLMLEEMGYL